MKRVWQRAATCALAALASVWFTTATGRAQKGGVEGCDLPSPGPLSGTYEGKFSGLLVMSGGEVKAVFQNKVEGNLSLKVVEATGDAVAQVTAGEGDVKYGMLGKGGESPAAGKVFAAIGTEQSGGLEFESGGGEQFTLSGRMTGGGLTATGVGKTVAMSKTVGGGGSAGSMTLQFKPDVLTSDCYTLRGTFESPELAEMAAGFQGSGLQGTWGGRTFEATLKDDNGLRAEAERVKSEVTSVPPKPRPNAIRKYREVLKEIDGSSRRDAEKACLRVALWEGYLPRSHTWLKEDLDELKQLGKTAKGGTDLDRTRVQRLVGQSLGRAGEAMLLGCQWSETESTIPTCEATMSAVIDALLRQNMALWDEASVRNLLQWTHDAALLGGNTEKALGAVRQWAVGVATAKYNALKALGLPKPPADNGPFMAALREALAAQKQAQLLGGSPPDPLELWRECKAKGACS